MYDWISKKPWLLRGDPCRAAFDRAGFSKELGPLVSGDYRAATDNLPTEVASAILLEAAKSSAVVPTSVWAYALEMLRPVVSFRDSSGLWDSFEVRRGQMMGSYLSFPLLCLQNFVAFRYALFTAGRSRERLPLLINGDDILFQSDESFFDHWKSVVGMVGLEVETSKTSFSSSYGTINSTLVRWRRQRLRVVPTVRLGVLRHRDYLNGIGRSFSSFVRGLPPDVAWAAGKEFFRWNVSALRRSGYYANEWGFRGRLAWRLASIFSLVPTTHDVAVPPPAPSVHDVQIPSYMVAQVPKGSLGDELQALNAAEMTCWKWSHEYNRTSSALRYFVLLSSGVSSRSPGPDLCPLLRGTPVITLTSPSRSSMRKLFLQPPESVRQLCFLELLALQDFSEFDVLPRYEETVLEVVRESGPRKK
jgi:hypothetical protein